MTFCPLFNQIFVHNIFIFFREQLLKDFNVISFAKKFFEKTRHKVSFVSKDNKNRCIGTKFMLMSQP